MTRLSQSTPKFTDLIPNSKSLELIQTVPKVRIEVMIGTDYKYVPEFYKSISIQFIGLMKS